MTTTNFTKQLFVRKPQSFSKSKEKKENLSPNKKSDRFCRKPQTITNFPSYSIQREPMKVRNQEMDKISHEQINVCPNEAKAYEESEKENFVVQNENEKIHGQHKAHNQLQFSKPATIQQQNTEKSQSQIILTFLKSLQQDSSNNNNNQPQSLHSQFQQQSLSSGNASDQYSIVGEEDGFLTSLNHCFVISQTDESERDENLDDEDDYKKHGDSIYKGQLEKRQQSKCQLSKGTKQNICELFDINKHKSKQSLNVYQSASYEISSHSSQQQQQLSVVELTYSTSNYSKANGINKSVVLAKIIQFPQEFEQSGFLIECNRDLSQDYEQEALNVANNSNDIQKGEHQQQEQLITLQQEKKQQVSRDIIIVVGQQKNYTTIPAQNNPTDSFGNKLLQQSSSLYLNNLNNNNQSLQLQQTSKILQIPSANYNYQQGKYDHQDYQNHFNNEHQQMAVNYNIASSNQQTASFLTKQSHYNRNKYCSFFNYSDHSSQNSSHLTKKNQLYNQQHQQQQQQRSQITEDGHTSQSIPTSESGYTFTDSAYESYHNDDIDSSDCGEENNVSIELNIKPKYNDRSLSPQKNNGKSGNNFYYQFDRNYEEYDDDSQNGECDYYAKKGNSFFIGDNGENGNRSNNNHKSHKQHKRTQKQNNNNPINRFKSPQLMRHLPSTLHNPTSHKDKFYNNHMQKMDTLIVQILQMKKDFQLHYLDNIHSQTQKCENNTAMIMRQLAEIQNKLDNQHQRLSGQDVYGKKQNNKSFYSNNKHKANNNKLKKLINYSSKNYYNHDNNEQSYNSNASRNQFDSQSQQSSQLQCSIAQQLHAAKHNKFQDNCSNSRVKIAFQNNFVRPQKISEGKMQKNEQQYSKKQNQIKSNHDDRSILLSKPSKIQHGNKKNLILSIQSNNKSPRNRRNQLPICVQQESHNKSSSLIKNSNNTFFKQSHTHEGQVPFSLTFSSSKRKRSRNCTKVVKESEQQKNEHKEGEDNFQFKQNGGKCSQSIVMNHYNNVSKDNIEWTNSWDDDYSGTISDNTSVQYSDNEQVVKRQEEIFQNNNDCYDDNSKNLMMLNSLPYVSMVVSTKRELKKALKQIKKPHNALMNSLIQADQHNQQQHTNSNNKIGITDNEDAGKLSCDNYNFDKQWQQEVDCTNQQKSKLQQQHQQIAKIVVNNNNNINTNKNSVIMNHETLVSQQQQKSIINGNDNNESDEIDLSAPRIYQNKQLIRMRSVGVYYDKDQIDIDLNDCKNYVSNQQKRRTVVDDGNRGDNDLSQLQLICQQRKQAISNNNINQLQKQVKQSQCNNSKSINNKEFSIRVSQQQQQSSSDLIQKQQQSICRITQPQIILFGHTLYQHKLNVLPQRQQPLISPISFNKRLKQGRGNRGVIKRVDLINFRQGLLKQRRQVEKEIEHQQYSIVIASPTIQNSPIPQQSNNSNNGSNTSCYSSLRYNDKLLDHYHHQESTAQSTLKNITKYTFTNSPAIQILPDCPAFDSIYYQRNEKQLYKYKWFKFK